MKNNNNNNHLNLSKYHSESISKAKKEKPEFICLITLKGNCKFTI